MSRIAFVNGAYVLMANANAHIEDRGYQFSDGIYEVILVVDGQFWDFDGHMARWQRSLRELSIDAPVSETVLKIIIRKLLKKNRLGSALVYMQATRGVAPRNHAFPTAATSTLTLTAKPFDLSQSDALAQKGAAVITHEDIRWGRVDIKTISLLPNVLAKEKAQQAGANEAWLIKDGFITEGSSTNAWIVDQHDRLITHPKNTQILGGITREAVIHCANRLGLTVVEKAFSLEEAALSKEAFFTSATSLVMPVVRINGSAVGAGKPGPIAITLRGAYVDFCGQSLKC